MGLNLALIPAGTKLESNGNGESFDISSSESRTFLCCLTVSEQLEQESLDVSIWGSADGQNWGTKPILSFPQKFYCGTYQILLDLTDHPDLKYVRAKWQLNRWGKGDPKPLFTVYLFAQQMVRTLSTAGA